MCRVIKLGSAKTVHFQRSDADPAFKLGDSHVAFVRRLACCEELGFEVIEYDPIKLAFFSWFGLADDRDFFEQLSFWMPDDEE